MIRGVTRVFLEVVGAVIILLAVGAGVLLWRLSHGPLPLNFARASLERLLSNPAQGRQVAISESELVWDHGDRAIELRAHGVRVRLAAAGPTAALPELSARFSLSGLAQGQLLPLDLTLIRPAIRALRDAGGQIQVGDAEAGAGDNPMATLDSLLDADPSRDLSLRLLSTVRIVDGSLDLDDQQTGRVWHLPRINLTIARHARRVAVIGDAIVALEGTPVRVTGSAEIGPDQAEMPMRIGFEPIPAPLLIGLLPPGTIDAAYDGSLGGSVTATLSAGLRLRRLGVELALGPGTLTEAHLPGPVAVQAGALKGTADFAARTVTIEQARVEFGGVVLSVTGHAVDDGDALGLDADLRVQNLLADDLKRYWPPTVGPNPRRWLLANASKGTIREATAKVAAHYRRATEDWTLQGLDGTLLFEKLRLVYLAGLPAVDDVAGSGTFSAARMDLAVTGGTLKRMHLDSGAVGISGLDTTNQVLDLSLLIKGPISDALAVLDAPRLGYITKFGIQAASVAGDQVTRLTAQFPLVDKLKLDLVKLGAKATLEHVAAPAVFRGQAVSDGTFGADITRDGMQVTGRAAFAGMPLSLIWTEHFTDGAPFRRRFDVTGTADDAARAALGIEVAPTLTGPVDADLVYEEADARRASLHANLDLTRSALSAELLGWTKPAGTPAQLRADLGLLDGRFDRIAGFQLSGDGLAAGGSGRFDRAGQLTQLKLAPLRVGNTDLGSVDVQRAGDRLTIAASGTRFDAGRLMDQLSKTDAPANPRRIVEVSANVGEVALGPDRVARQVQGSLRVAGDRVQAAQLNAVVGTAKVEVTVAPRQGGRDLVIRARDAGSLLKSTGLLESMVGGQLVVSGRFSDDPSAERLSGHLDVSDFRLVRLPVLARLVAVASVTGIPEMLAGDGIAFRHLYADFTRTAKRWEIHDSNASGLALGLNLHGTIERESDQADLAGTLVPANGINQVLSSIPLIGNILTGGPNGGVIAFVFSLTGPLENPTVAVNPLSALTPGILRKIFELPSGGPSAPARPRDGG